MNLEENIYIKNAIEAFNDLKKNPFDILKIITADVLFLFLTGLLSAPLLNKMMEHGGKLAMEVIRSIQQGKMITIFGEQLRPLTFLLIQYVLLLFILYYLLYILFQGYAWGLTKKIIDRRINLKEFIIKFAKINIFWFVLFIIYKILDIFAGVRSLLLQASGIEITDYLKITLAIFVLIAYYFAPITYVQLGVRKGISMGIKKIHKIIPIFIGILILYLAMEFLIGLVPMKNVKFALSFLYLPLIAWTRIYLNRTIEKI